MNGAVASEVGFFSNLSDGITDNILAFLPLRDIARPSILSREWRYNWLSCPQLVFDGDFYKDTAFFLRRYKPETLIYQILERHQGRLLKFVLQVDKPDSCPDINEWIHMLPNHNLQSLTLCIATGINHRLTSPLFSFQNLRNLKLFNCRFYVPAEFNGFRELLSLDLENCTLVQGTFGKFVASCPVIERMRLIQGTSFDFREITGPKLKSFDFRGLFASISFKNCHVLSHVKLSFHCKGFHRGQFSFHLVESLSSLPSLENLKLQAFALEDLVEYGAPNELPISLKMLKVFHISDMLLETDKTSSIICFIRSCPNLQRLNVITAAKNVEEFAAVLLCQNMNRLISELSICNSSLRSSFDWNS